MCSYYQNILVFSMFVVIFPFNPFLLANVSATVFSYLIFRSIGVFNISGKTIYYFLNFIFQVVIKLAKDSSQKSRLFFRRLADIQINYQHMNRTSNLELFLFEIDDHFQLNVKLPSCVIAEDRRNMVKIDF